MTTIPAPAPSLLVEAVHTLGLLAASVWMLTVGQAVRRGQASPRFLPGSLLVMAGVSLLTPLATLMMPLYLGLALWPGGCAGRRSDQRGPWILALTVGWLIGQTSRYVLSPDIAWSHWALWLRPWFGARWFLSTLWFLAMAPIAVLALRWFHRPPDGPPLRSTQLNLTGTLMPMAAIWLLLVAACYRWGLSGQEFLGRSLFIVAALFSALTAVMRTWALWRSRSRSGRRLDGLPLAWLVLACLVGWGAFDLAASHHAPAAFFESTWTVVGPRDLLFLPHGSDRTPGTVPLDLARTGQVQVYENLGALRDHLAAGRLEMSRSHRHLWVLTRQTSFPSWLIPVPDPRAVPPWTLCLADLSRDPGPITLFKDGQPAQADARITGLHADGVWTHQTFSLTFDGTRSQAGFLDIILRGWRPENAGPLDARFAVTLNDRVLNLVDQQLTFFRWEVPPGLLRARDNRLVLRVPTFVPRAVDLDSADGRELGVDLETIILR